MRFGKLTKRENVRRLLAIVFMIVLVAEWGSHGMQHSDLGPIEGQAFSAPDHHHDDPFHKLALCAYSNRHDQQAPSFNDHPQYSGLVDRHDVPRVDSRLVSDPPLPFHLAHGLFRPVTPPFHPPRLS